MTLLPYRTQSRRKSFRSKLIQGKLRKYGGWIVTIFISTLIFGMLCIEILLFSKNALPSGEDYVYIDPVTVENKHRKLFDLIDNVPDGTISLSELEGFALHRFRSYANTDGGGDEVDHLGRPVIPIDKSIFDDLFLRKMDINNDGQLVEDELTPQNVKALFDKANEVMVNLDTNQNGLITWEEFYGKPIKNSQIPS